MTSQNTPDSVLPQRGGIGIGGGGAEEMVQWIKLLIYTHEDCNSFQKETKQNRRAIDPSYRNRKSIGQGHQSH